MKTAILAACLLFSPALATAQENPLSDHARMMYSGMKLWLVGAAEKMPEASYGYRPASDVRGFGEIIGHLADNQYRFCSLALGEKNAALNIEKTRKGKAELIAALKDAVAYCDRAYNGLTDATAAEMLKAGIAMPRIGVLTTNNLHNALHYGNLITYLRMNDIVPPSSDPAFMPKLPKGAAK